MYNQCKLKRNNEEQVTWIPQKFAKVGKVVKLKEEDGWQDGWEVISVGQVMTEGYLSTLRDLYRYHRDATDV